MSEPPAVADRADDAAPRRLLIIYNPAAGQRRRRRFEAVLGALRARGCPLVLRETAGPGDAEALARGADPEAADLVVAAGGDGTINEVVNGLAGPGGPGDALPLAVLPLGTANVLAAEIGLDFDPAALARTIAEGPARPVALGQANDRLFSVVLGAGFDAHAVDGVDTRLKRVIGKGAYVWEAARQLFVFGFPEYRVMLDGTRHGAASVIVAKGRYYAGRFVVAPEGRFAEPLLQVCLFTRPGAWNALRYAAALGLRRLDRLPDVRVLPAREVVIEGPEGDPVQGDGDILTRLPVTVRVLPEALKIVMPPEGR
jgi:YegS/Rv2252/BmrU family lipid kinase